MKQQKSDKFRCKKDTHWDRIRKRNSNHAMLALKSEVVRRFIEKDFIGRKNEAVLCGEPGLLQQLDPALLMDMRHKMFQKIPRKLPLVTVGGQRTLDACVSHNLAVEERYIMNELNKFRQQLEKNHRRIKLKVKQKAEVSRDHLQLESDYILRSVKKTAEHIDKFYEAPIGALQATKYLSQRENENIQVHRNGNDLNDVEMREKLITYGEVTEDLCRINNAHKGTGKELKIFKEDLCVDIDNEDEKFLNYNKRICILECNSEVEDKSFKKEELKQQLLLPCKHVCRCNAGNRCVRFRESVEVRKFNREDSSCSNTSEGIDSVISDIAEEALIELQRDGIEIFSKKSTKLLNIDNLAMSNAIKVMQNAVVSDYTIQSELFIVNVLKTPQNSQIHFMNQDNSAISTLEDAKEEQSHSNHEQNRIIEELFQPRALKNHALLRKYFLKWVHYTTIEKIEREDVSSKSDRIYKINLFLDKVRKEKRQLIKCSRDCPKARGQCDRAQIPLYTTKTAQMTKKYQNKIKIQQDIIDIQRIKLERQERMIMELKLYKLSEESKEARHDLQNELKSVIRSGNPKSQVKAKCLQLIGNFPDGEDEQLKRLQGKALILPKFLQKMQERALERSIKHEQARQRRLQQEEEKEAQRIAADEAKRLEDEEAKRQRIEALQEKRRQEKMFKILRERERQRALQARKKAEEFSRRLLLKRVGMEGFKRLLQRKRDNKHKCEELRRKIFKRTYFEGWRNLYLQQRDVTLMRADQLYEKILMRQSWIHWQFYIQDERCKYQVAIDWCELKLTELIFKHWRKYSQRMSLLAATKMNQAALHHQWHLKWKVIDSWQRLPNVLQLERETEERRQRWRMKVWELLPDYKPNVED